MQKNKLGNSDIYVSKVCLGTMTWGEQNSQTEAFSQLDYAIDNGVNFIDTAELYAVPPKKETCGRTEEIIGHWLQKSGKRDEIVIATKMAGPNVSWIREGEGLVEKHITQAIDDSLRRLQTDVIDLFQLHWPQRSVALWGKQNYQSTMMQAGADEQIEHFYRALAKECQKGKIRYLGLSNETPWGTMKYQQIAEHYDLPRMVSIQNSYSIVRRDFEVGLSEVALYEKIGLLAYSPLAGGFLSGKYRDNMMPDGSRFQRFPQLMGYYNNSRSIEAIEHYQKIADGLGISLTQLCLAFINDQAFVTSNIIGATSMAQLQENIGSAAIRLSQETLDEIDKVFTQYPNPGNY